MSGEVGVVQAAELLGVHRQRVHQRIRDGSLSASKVGNQWVIQLAEVQRLKNHGARSGRPLSMRSAHGLVALSVPYENIVRDMDKSERSRLAARYREWFHQSDEARVRFLRSLQNRAHRRLYGAATRDLSYIREDGRLHLSGLSGPHSAIAASDVVEGYLEVSDLDQLVEDHLLSQANSSAANVILHVVPQGSRLNACELADAPLANAADLADHDGPREQAAALNLAAGLSAGRG